ncbi:hypothetical protein PybrP1_001804 [[Pythium] brassicae (nom. inval.)]|nr:hypothetical protein PybrP1_001804 [[Pythium] brassicae (nom. inval.)]
MRQMDSTDEMLASQGMRPITERTAGSHGRAVALCMAACVGLVCIGYEQAVMGVKGSASSSATNASTIGYIAGALLGGLLADFAGRRVAIAVGCVAFAVGLWVVEATKNDSVDMAGRAMQGLGGGGYLFVLPIYCVEVVAKERRGLLAGFAMTLLGTGHFLGTYLAVETDVLADETLAYVVPQVPMLLLAIGCACLPESPRWVYLRKGKEVAETSLKHIRNTWLVQSELNAIAAQVAAIGDVSGWGALADFSVVQRIASLTVLLTFQLVFASTASDWFSSFMSLEKPKNFVSSIFSDFKFASLVIEVASAVPALVTVDAVGRRSLLVTGIVGMTIAHAILGIAVTSGCDSNGEALRCSQASAEGVFVGAMLLLLSYAACWSPALWVYPAEVFPTNVRTKAGAIVAVLSGVSTFWVRELFPKLLELSLVSAGLCLLSLGLVLALCPETKRLLLEDTEELFAHGFHSKHQRDTMTTEISVSDKVARKKRRADNEVSPAHTSDEASSDVECASAVAAQARGGRTRKKNWYYVQQKEETVTLRQEIKRLEALKAEFAQVPGAPRSLKASLYKQQRETERLREVVWEQQLLVARVQSGIAGGLSAGVFPLERFIRLGRDWKQRAATFVEVREAILREARQYIAERTRHLHRTFEYSQCERFWLPGGDMCITSFEIAPLAGFVSVKQVLDTMRAYYFNLEIEWTENSGELMIREGDFETGEEGVGTQRLVRAINSGVQVESNLVLVSKLVKGRDAITVNADGSVGDSAYMACDYVNEDELFPYRPKTRLRQDNTSATAIKMYPSKDPSASPVIVLTQAYACRIRQSEAGAIPREVVYGSTFDPSYCFKALMRTLYECVRLPQERYLSVQ